MFELNDLVNFGTGFVPNRLMIVFQVSYFERKMFLLTREVYLYDRPFRYAEFYQIYSTRKLSYEHIYRFKMFKFL